MGVACSSPASHDRSKPYDDTGSWASRTPASETCTNGAVSAVLVTGMSATGKSSVLAELARRGHRVVDTDYGEWIEEVPLSESGGTERLCYIQTIEVE